MNRLEKIVYVQDSINIIPLGDIHWKSPNTDIASFRQTVKHIAAQENTLCIGTGDWWDSILPDDKRADASAPYNPLDELWGELRAEIEPIKDKFLSLHLGNHELTLIKRGVGNPIAALCREWGTLYGGYSSFTRLVARKTDTNGNRTKSSVLEIYTHHGWFSGRQRGGKINNAEGAARDYEADLYIFGHCHDLISTKREQLYHYGVKQKAFVIAGTFLKTNAWNAPPGYAEVHGYPPAMIGVPCVTWDPWYRKEQGGAVQTGNLTLTI